jgi:peptidoglycan/LPS O-acetylase OafA/YrhL
MQKQEPGRVFHTLDLLRGLAAIGVVVLHMKDSFLPVRAPGGYLAVDLFFMMSGVVLSHAYEARFRSGMGTVGFMRARLIRLYPLYLVGTLFGIAVTFASLLGHNINGWTVPAVLTASLLALVFLPSLGGAHGDQLFPLNIPSWSLFFEILVNLLFVLFWPVLRSGRLAALCVVSGAAVAFAAVHAGHLDLGSTAATLGSGLARTVFGFSVGVLLARHVANRARMEASGLVVAVVIAVVVLAIVVSPSNPYRPWWDLLCVLVVFPVVVGVSTRVDPSPRWRPVASFLGLTSYAVYVFHTPLAAVLNSANRVFAGAWFTRPPWAGLCALVLLLAGCWFVDRHLDTPVRRYLARALPGR